MALIPDDAARLEAELARLCEGLRNANDEVVRDRLVTAIEEIAERMRETRAIAEARQPPRQEERTNAA